MTAKFHINPQTGDPSECHALVKCPFGGDDKHFPSVAEARTAFEKSQGSQFQSLIKAHDQRVISGNWTNDSDKVAEMPGERMNRHEMQLFALSTISHNLHPAIGQFRLAVSSGDQSKIEKIRNVKDNYISTAAVVLAEKLDGDAEVHTKFLTETIHEAFDPVFAEFEKDAYAKIKLDPILDDLAIKVADYSKRI